MDTMILKAVLLRFLKAGLASAFSMAGTVTYFAGVTTWQQFPTALSALSLCLVVGFITGVLMAGEKYFNWQDTPPAA